MNCATALKATLVFSLVVVATSGVLAQAPVAVNPAIDAMERQLEIGRHERLLTRMAENDAALNAFTTDGCSGGLSIGWEQLAGRFPEFSARHGDEPPWQECCVIHDRRYHAGGEGAVAASESFDQRRTADLELATCVVETGVRQSLSLQEIYGLSESQIRLLYHAIAELMYRAVRLGGIPCTTQAWRWGYGWPNCR